MVGQVIKFKYYFSYSTIKNTNANQDLITSPISLPWLIAHTKMHYITTNHNI